MSYTSSRPPVDLETKGAAPALAPKPGVPDPDTATVSPEGIVEMIAAVTGIRDAADDVIIPGAFTRTLKSGPRPKVCRGHDWSAPIGRLLAIKELMPGDPRLPTRTGDGRPWPAKAGALVCTAQLNMSSKSGREAFEIIRFFGPAESAFSIGYQVPPGGATHRGGLRYIKTLDLYEVSPVLHGCNSYAGLISAKSIASAEMETKSTTGAVRTTRRGLLGEPINCTFCGREAATALLALGPKTKFICPDCRAAVDQLGVDSGYVPPEVVEQAAQLAGIGADQTPEEAYEAAVSDEVPWYLNPDGTLGRGTSDGWSAQRRNRP